MQLIIIHLGRISEKEEKHVHNSMVSGTENGGYCLVHLMREVLQANCCWLSRHHR